jgi:hypothetical protein
MPAAGDALWAMKSSGVNLRGFFHSNADASLYHLSAGSEWGAKESSRKHEFSRNAV